MSNRKTQLISYAITKRQANSLRAVIHYSLDAEMKHYFESDALDRSCHIYRHVKTVALAIGLYNVSDFKHLEERYSP